MLTHLVIRLALLLATGTALYVIIDWPEVCSGLLQLRIQTIFFAVGVLVIRNGLQGYRWKLLNTDVADEIPKWEYFSYMMCSTFFNLIMPGGMGGDLLRSGLVYKRAKSKKGINALSVWTDRLLGLFSNLCLGLMVGVFAPELPNRHVYLLAIGGLLGGFAILFLFCREDKGLNWLDQILARCGKLGHVGRGFLGNIRSANLYYRSRPSCLLKALAMSIPVNLCSCFAFYLVVSHFWGAISFLQVITIASLLWVILSIPITFSGFGVRELTLIYLLQPYGVSANLATMISLGYFAIAVALGIIGIPFILMVRIRCPRPSERG